VRRTADKDSNVIDRAPRNPNASDKRSAPMSFSDPPANSSHLDDRRVELDQVPQEPSICRESQAATTGWALARLSELARRVRQHERITLTRNGEPEAVLLSVDDLEGLEMTLEILGDAVAAGRISESLAALERGEPGADVATVRQDLARRRATGR
jgi:antitoxin YefM